MIIIHSSFLNYIRETIFFDVENRAFIQAYNNQICRTD